VGPALDRGRLAGSWICHSPVALWLTVISAGLYLPTLIRRRPSSGKLRLAAFLAAAFMILGSEPFVSVLTLDNQNHSEASGSQAAAVIRSVFPANFKPINADRPDLAQYQLGYALLGTLVISLCLSARRRPPVVWGFVAATLLIIPFTVPCRGSQASSGRMSRVGLWTSRTSGPCSASSLSGRR